MHGGRRVEEAIGHGRLGARLEGQVACDPRDVGVALAGLGEGAGELCGGQGVQKGVSGERAVDVAQVLGGGEEHRHRPDGFAGRVAHLPVEALGEPALHLVVEVRDELGEEISCAGRRAAEQQVLGGGH